MNKQRLANRNKVAQTPKYWVRLTHLCNNNCVFCLDKEMQNGTIIAFNKIKQQLRQGRKKGFAKLILSGGEATLHPDYLRILEFGSSIGYKGIQTVTNGRMFAYPDFLKQAVANGLTEATFSLHGHTKQLYEKQSGIKGSYRQALTGLLNALHTKDLIVNVDIVINKMNFKQLEQIIRFYVRLGVGEFDLLQVVPFGAGWKNKRKVFYDPRHHLSALHKAFALQEEFPWIYLWTNRLPAVYLEGFEELIQHPFKLKDEVRGRRDIFLDYINNDTGLDCKGERCRYCFMEVFCRDLTQVKENGLLPPLPNPECIKEKQPPVPDYLWSNFDLDTYTDFFINHRYFVKSFRCASCRRNKSCAGMHIIYVREHGFKVLKPIK